MKILRIQQKVFKITDHYPIMDENDHVVYRVDQEFHFFKTVLHISGAQGEHLFTISRTVFSFLPRFEIEFASGGRLLLQSRLRLLKKQIDVLPESSGIVVEGDFFSKSFSVSRHGEVIGRIDRKLFSIADRFQIEVYDEEYQDLFVAVMIAVDAILDSEQNG